MRLYISFGYDTKHLRFHIGMREMVIYDLAGYDIDPTLISIKIEILFFELEIGNLFKNIKP